MTRRLIILPLMLILPIVQGTAGGPPYSRFGFGDILSFGGNRPYGMGIAGVALTQDGYVNLLNPATVSRLSFTRFAGGFEYRNSLLDDGTGTQRFAAGSFQSLALAIPASEEHGIVLFASTSPYSLMDYDVEIRDSVAGAPATQRLTGTGGLSDLSLGGSFRPIDALSLGIRYTYHYGALQQRLMVDFDDDAFADNELRATRYHGGSSVTLGFTYQGFATLFDDPSLAPLTFAASVTSPARLSVKEERLLLTQSTADTAQVRRGTATLPLSWAAGVALALPSIVVSGDVLVTHWKPENFFEPPSVDIRTGVRAGLGVEFPARQNPTSYWDRVAYRAGFTYTASYLALHGQPIDSWAVSGGIALPIGPDARLNIGLQAGSRGTTSHGLAQETFFRLSFSVDASEAWFITIEDD